MLFKSAVKNFVRQGLRAILNVLVTALTIIAVIFNMSLLNGFQAQATRNMVSTDVAGGHYVVPGFDLLTPTEWEDHTGTVPEKLKALPPDEKAELLLLQGQMFPNNRLYPVQLRGINMEQKLLDLPLDGLVHYDSEFGDTLPVTLGSKMAKRTHLKKGDTVVLKWRDKYGAVDALDVRVVEVVHFVNPRIDEGIVWMRLDHLRKITSRPGEVSWVAVKENLGQIDSFKFKSETDLMSDLLALLENDRRHAKILWAILLLLTGISVFNTQILNVFKRQKEIGVLLAMGMDAPRVVRLFTLEGSLAAFVAIVVAILLGVPLFYWFQSVGLDISHLKESTIPVHENIKLHIKPDEVLLSLFIIVSIMILVAWLPVRKISRLDPTLALRGTAIR